MLLIKLTALIMGMVMSLTGMNNAFPQSSLLPEQGKRPHRRPACHGPEALRSVLRFCR